MSWLGERRPVLSIDTETGGLSWVNDPLRLVQFGDGATGWAMSYRDWRGLAVEALQKYEGPIVGHNINFDKHFLQSAGLPMPAEHYWHDTLVMDFLLDPARSHALKTVCERHWPGSQAGQQLLKDAMHQHKWSWATVPTDFPYYWAYSALDTVLTARLAEALWPQVNAEGYRAAYDREMAAKAILYRAERRGVRLDPWYTGALREEWINEMDGLTAELQALGLENASSGRQVAAAMQATEKWDPDDWTETGQPKVDEKVLKGIDSEISRRVLRYRRLRKWTSSYLETFLREKDSNDRLHASINTTQARTGRMSITKPALQTLPRGPEIRRCMIADEGHKLWAVDYDTQELRVFASYAQEPGLIEAFRAGLDLHTYAASQVYGVDYDAVTKNQRQTSKNVGYAKIYGAGPAKIADTAGVSVAEVQTFLAVYGQRFPKVDEFMRQVDAIARQRVVQEGRAYVKSHGGRILTADPQKIYALVNHLVQGGCADVLKAKLISLDACGYGDTIVLPIHDEILFSLPDGADDEVPKIVEIMEDHESFAVPLTCVASGPYDNWGKKYE